MEVLLLAILAAYVVIISSGMEAESPEEFLVTLSSFPADQWVELQLQSDSAFVPDSITTLIESLRNLSVEPGDRILEDIEGGYRVIFPESRWTWRKDGGRIGSVIGQSVIEWHPGGYSWVTLPVITEEGASIGRKESLCMGVTAMMAIGVIGIIAIWYAKRRYGS